MGLSTLSVKMPTDDLQDSENTLKILHIITKMLVLI